MNLEVIKRVAAAHPVKRLESFGSAARGETPNDYDFLVVFDPLPPLEHGRAYFALLEDLQDMLDKPVDLIEVEALQNPYFLRSIEAGRVLLYSAEQIELCAYGSSSLNMHLV
jgi:uncharacterized protein